MGKFTKAEAQEKMTGTGLVPVFYHADPDIARGVVDASYAAGVRAFEFTNRGTNAYDVFVKLVDHVKKYEDLALGIGTVMDGPTAEKFIDAGTHFVVSPIVKPDMASVCAAREMLWVPGCGTVTEIVTGRDLGAQLIKIFPGSVLGPGFVSAVMPVLQGIQIMPTGGVEPNEQNLGAWFKAGVACVGMGSQLFKKEILAAKDWTALTKQISAALQIIKQIRAK